MKFVMLGVAVLALCAGMVFQVRINQRQAELNRLVNDSIINLMMNDCYQRRSIASVQGRKPESCVDPRYKP